MSLLFMDSFDHYVTADILEKWSFLNFTPQVSTTGGRRGGCLTTTGTSSEALSKNLNPTGTTFISGFAIKFGSLNLTPMIRVTLDGANQMYIAMNGATGLLAAYRGTPNGTVIATATIGAVTTSVYHYIECKLVIHPSAGSVIVKINGLEVINVTAVNTAGTGTQGYNGFRLLGGFSSVAAYTLDDLYISDGSGPAPWNDLLGDCRVDARYPTAPGATTGWTPSTGANWQNVDDTAPDDDTTYNSAPTAGLIDTFVVQDAPVVGATVFGIQHNISVKKSDAGAGQFAHVIRHAGVDNVGPTMSLGTNYSYLTQIATEIAPGVPITEANFNAAEFGYKRIT